MAQQPRRNKQPPPSGRSRSAGNKGRAKGSNKSTAGPSKTATARRRRTQRSARRGVLAWVRHHRFFLGFLFAVLIGLLGLVMFQVFGRSVSVSSPSYLYIPTGATYQTVLDSLAHQGNGLQKRLAFRAMATLTGYPNAIQPGRYALRPGMSNYTLLRNLQGGRQVPVRLTFGTHWTREALARQICRPLEITPAELLEQLRAPQVQDSLGLGPERLRLLFLPNTYEVYWDVGPRQLLFRFQKEYKRFWTPARRQKARAAGLTPEEAGILASIVQEETRRADEMPTIAGVYINRLAANDRLQADPTVKYAVRDFDLRRVLQRHYLTNSPYNTYLNKGLPPGPIQNPEPRAIKAVLNYERHDYKFFVAKPDFSGYHDFSETYAEHQRKAARYHRELDRRNY